MWKVWVARGELKEIEHFRRLFLLPAGRLRMRCGEVGVRKITLNGGARTYCGAF